eukprot:1543358-Pleurochrysis_carterae.AAC.7
MHAAAVASAAAAVASTAASLYATASLAEQLSASSPMDVGWAPAPSASLAAGKSAEYNNKGRSLKAMPIVFDAVDGELRANGEPFIVRGLNWFGSEGELGVPYGLKERASEDLLDFVARSGFNALRILFNWESVTQNREVDITAFRPSLNPQVQTRAHLPRFAASRQRKIHLGRCTEGAPGSSNMPPTHTKGGRAHALLRERCCCCRALLSKEQYTTLGSADLFAGDAPAGLARERPVVQWPDFGSPGTHS